MTKINNQIELFEITQYIEDTLDFKNIAIVRGTGTTIIQSREIKTEFWENPILRIGKVINEYQFALTLKMQTIKVFNPDGKGLKEIPFTVSYNLSLSVERLAMSFERMEKILNYMDFGLERRLTRDDDGEIQNQTIRNIPSALCKCLKFYYRDYSEQSSAARTGSAWEQFAIKSYITRDGSMYINDGSFLVKKRSQEDEENIMVNKFALLIESHYNKLQEVWDKACSRVEYTPEKSNQQFKQEETIREADF